MSDKKKCSTPDCPIYIMPSKDRTICLFCDLENTKDTESKAQITCTLCQTQICPSAPYLSEEKGQCYDCFLEKCWKKNNELCGVSCSPPGGLSVDEKECIDIFVKALTGKTIFINIRKDLLIYDLMLEIDKKEHLPYDSYTLVGKGAKLMPHKSLLSYGIENETTIHLISNLRGS